MTSPGHFNGQTIPAYTDVLTDPDANRAALECLVRHDATDVAEALGMVPYEGAAGGGQWKHTDGKPRRTDQPTGMKRRWAKSLAARPDLSQRVTAPADDAIQQDSLLDLTEGTA